MKDLLVKLLEWSGRIHDYVVLRKDSGGFFIEYAFTEGAPHDNRCLDWYHSFQPEARKRCGWDEDLLEAHKKSLDEKVGKLYGLGSFTCGGEEDPETQLNRARKSYCSGEEFIPEEHVCRVGNPAPMCKKTHCPGWTYQEPVKCACWCLEEVEDPSKIVFSFTAETLKEFLCSSIE